MGNVVKVILVRASSSSAIIDIVPYGTDMISDLAKASGNTMSSIDRLLHDGIEVSGRWYECDWIDEKFLINHDG